MNCLSIKSNGRARERPACSFLAGHEPNHSRGKEEACAHMPDCLSLRLFDCRSCFRTFRIVGRKLQCLPRELLRRTELLPAGAEAVSYYPEQSWDVVPLDG